jgi:GNAT superfamily N-acetyltransferase
MGKSQGIFAHFRWDDIKPKTKPMPLNNPIYNALTSLESPFNIGNSEVAYFPSTIAPFIGLPNWSATQQQKILDQTPPDRNWFVIYGQPITFTDAFKIIFSIPLYQLTCNTLSISKKYAETMLPLGSQHIEEMIALTSLTKPGPFSQRTIEFGNYHGIFKDDKLVAMGGERMHLNGYTEISAICTHPDFQGRGFGAQIVHFLSDQIIAKGQIPFLHARIDNVTALNVYKRMGYVTRAEMYFAIFARS